MIRSLYKSFHAGERTLAKKLLLSSTEGARVANELLTAQMLKNLLAKDHSGDGHGVIVLPGFLGRDRTNGPLVKFLNSLGYVSSGWNLGRNLGHGRDVRERMMREIDFRLQQTGEKVTLIGHSLGGLYSRELARVAPEKVERVITLGSPFGRNRSDPTAASKLYWTLNRNRDRTHVPDSLRPVPPVPVTSVFTRSDAVIDWRNARQDRGHSRSENVEVYGSHCGLTVNPAVWYLLLDRLSTDSNNWQPFDNSGWRRTIYPLAARCD
ncbi:MAG: alpha/beta hydrolase [Arenicella sp.]|nr:alpha/beta hydrolase [Arenicella sp.]